jgi:hypothetical protein
LAPVRPASAVKAAPPPVLSGSMLSRRERCLADAHRGCCYRDKGSRASAVSSTHAREDERRCGLASHERRGNRQLRNRLGRRPSRRRERQFQGPAVPRKEEPVLAGFELTPTAPVDEPQHSAADVGSLPLRRSSGCARRTSRAAAIGVVRARGSTAADARFHRSPVAKRTSAKATIQHLDRPPFRGHGSG